MKKIILLSLLTYSLAAQKKLNFSERLSAAAKEQNAPNPLYTFSTYNSTYFPITGTSLTNGLKWDDAVFPVNLGFNFKLYSAQGSTINFAEGTFATFNSPNTAVITLAAPLFEDLCDRAFDPVNDDEGDPGGTSEISYTVTGTSGNRICVIQVKNAGFFGEILANNISVSFINFQLWLYEGTNDIEIRFGSVDIQNQSDNFSNPNGFLSGLAEQINLNTAACVSSNVLTGPATNPSMTGISTSLSEVVTGTVQSGIVYKFSRVSPSTVGIGTHESIEKIGMFPNPATTTLHFNDGNLQDLNNATVYFYSADGRLVSSKIVERDTDISEVAPGIYFVKVESANGTCIYSGKLAVVD